MLGTRVYGTHDVLNNRPNPRVGGKKMWGSIDLYSSHQNLGIKE